MVKRRNRRAKNTPKSSYHKMTKEEIGASREKLNIQVKSEGHHNLCSAHNCGEESEKQCSFCHRYFCMYHSSPSITTSLSQIAHMQPSDPKYKKYTEDWKKKNGHPCPAYTQWWNNNPNAKEYSPSEGLSGSGEGGNKKPIADIIVEGRPTKSSNMKSDNNWIKEHINLHTAIKSFVVAVALLILSSAGINLLKSPAIYSQTLLNSFQAIINFVAIFVILFIYDKVTVKHSLLYQEIIVSILLDALVWLITLNGSIIILVAFFVLGILLTLFGSVLGQMLYDFGKEKSHLSIFTGTIYFLIAIWIIYIMVLNYSSLVTTTVQNTIKNVSSGSNNFNVGNSSGNFNNVGHSNLVSDPYLTFNDLNQVFGFGLYSESSLNPSEIALGNGTKILFRTPIQHLLFNETLKNISVQYIDYVEYYNPSNVSVNETVIETNQASLILITAARNAATVIGQVNGTNYFAVPTATGSKCSTKGCITLENFILGAQKANYLAIVNCSGTSCSSVTLNQTVDKISSDLISAGQ